MLYMGLFSLCISCTNLGCSKLAFPWSGLTNPIQMNLESVHLEMLERNASVD